MDYKKRVSNSLNKFYSKEQKKLERENGTSKTVRKSPEKDFVKELCKWLNKYGFSYNIVEASTYDSSRSHGHTTRIDAGFSDIVACDRWGFACYIEAKAPGKRKSGLAPHQYEFLKAKINNNAFACCTESVEHIHNLYHQWIVMKLKVRELQVLRPVTMDQAGAESPNKLLIDDLFIPKAIRDDKIDPELGF